MTEPNPYSPPLAPVAEVPAGGEPALTRKKLVPLWIKIFGWIFMVVGAAVPLVGVVAVAKGQPGLYEIFGLQYRGSPLHPMALTISAILVTLAVSAYGLLFGKVWGLTACLVTGYGGVAICLGTTVYAISQGALTLRLELLVHIPYLIKLHKIKPHWALARVR